MQKYQDLKKYYVNLDFRVDRKENIESQVGQDFKRISAVNGKELGFEGTKKLFDLERSKARYEFTISAGAMSCTLSHYNIYKEVLADDSIAEDDWVLISEDDNDFIPDFRERMDQILAFLAQERFEGLDLCILRYSEYEDFVDYSKEVIAYHHNSDTTVYSSPKKEAMVPINHFRWLIKASTDREVFSFDYQGLSNPYDPELVEGNTQKFLLPTYYSSYSSALYIVKKRALRIIENFDKPYWLTDDFASFIPRINTFVAFPCLAKGAPEAVVSDVSKEKIVETEDTCRASTDFDEDYNLITYYVLQDFVNYYDPNPELRQAMASKLASLDLDLSNYEFEEKLKTGHKAQYYSLLSQAKVANKKDHKVLVDDTTTATIVSDAPSGCKVRRFFKNLARKVGLRK